MHILSKEEHHSPLSELNNWLINVQRLWQQDQTRGIPASFQTKNIDSRNSFLSRTANKLYPAVQLLG